MRRRSGPLYGHERSGAGTAPLCDFACRHEDRERRIPRVFQMGNHAVTDRGRSPEVRGRPLGCVLRRPQRRRFRPYLAHKDVAEDTEDADDKGAQDTALCPDDRDVSRRNHSAWKDSHIHRADLPSDRAT